MQSGSPGRRPCRGLCIHGVAVPPSSLHCSPACVRGMPNSLSAGRGRRCGCAACIRRPVFEIAAGYHQNASPSTSFGPEAASFAGMRRALSKAAYAASAMLGRQCAASSEAGAVDEKQTGKRHFDASPFRSRHGKNLLQAERDGALVAGQAFFLAARALEGR